MYSSAASVIRGHQETSRLTNFRRFSATSSIPSSVILLQPDRDSTVRLGSEWTKSAYFHWSVFRISYFGVEEKRKLMNHRNHISISNCKDLGYGRFRFKSRWIGPHVISQKWSDTQKILYFCYSEHKYTRCPKKRLLERW